MKTSIWWIRRDLRITDNQALFAAQNNSDQVIPVFILDQFLWNSPYVGEKRINFLLNGLRSLDQDLRKIGSRLIVQSGDPVQSLQKLFKETSADCIYAEEDFSQYARRRDKKIQQMLPLKLTNGLTAYHPMEMIKKDGTPYTIYSPFMRYWKSRPRPKASQVIPAPTQINSPARLTSTPIPDNSETYSGIPYLAGEQRAQEQLSNFVEGTNPAIFNYAESRDRPDLNNTSGLSPYLRFGMVSTRQAVVTAFACIDEAVGNEAQKSAEVWLNELIWREFYFSILYHFPFVAKQSFRSNLRNIQWANNEEDFTAWTEGKTGFPFVDAGMRQLKKIGWMHNRTRMVVASFLTKNLLIDWRWGERWFMEHLIDGDPASNNGGWQWTAGTGTDAAPYFRIFNPISQSKRFDPDGKYIRQWLPELRNVPDDFIHEPWIMPYSLQSKIGCHIGIEYPAPIIELAWSRQRALEIYGAAKKETK